MAMLDIRVATEQEGTRSQVLRWLKKPGEAVVENEPIVELETDKVNVEVAAPASGVLREILKQEREELSPNEVLGRIEEGATANATAPSRHSGEGASAIKQVSLPSSTLQGHGRRAAMLLSPAVRRLLNERGLDASAVRGTGQGGRVTVEDVLRASSNVANSPAPQTRAGRMVSHTPIRTRIAEHMTRSLLHTAPHVTSVFEVDMSAVIAHRVKHREDFQRRGVSLTFTAYFLRAAVAAIRAVPEANSRWTDTALEIFDYIDIGVATALDAGGLIIPVLRDVESRDFFDIARDLQDLVTRARAGNLQPAEVRGGTFTLSNHGVSGSLIAAPIVINQPQSAILGVGKLEKRAVIIEEGGQERIVARPKCYVTLTIDHRVMDGLQANRFLQAFVNTLERWPPDGPEVT